MPSSLRGAMLRLTPGPGGAGDRARRGRGRPLLCKLLLLLLESVIALCGELGHRGRPTAPTPCEGSPNRSRALLPWGAPTAAAGGAPRSAGRPNPGGKVGPPRTPQDLVTKGPPAAAASPPRLAAASPGRLCPAAASPPAPGEGDSWGRADSEEGPWGQHREAGGPARSSPPRSRPAWGAPLPPPRSLGTKGLQRGRGDSGTAEPARPEHPARGTAGTARGTHRSGGA